MTTCFLFFLFPSRWTIKTFSKHSYKLHSNVFFLSKSQWWYRNRTQTPQNHPLCLHHDANVEFYIAAQLVILEYPVDFRCRKGIVNKISNISCKWNKKCGKKERNLLNRNGKLNRNGNKNYKQIKYKLLQIIVLWFPMKPYTTWTKTYLVIFSRRSDDKCSLIGCFR